MSRIEGKLLKSNCEFFKIRTLLYVEKYFQKVWGLVRNCRWGFWISSVKQGKWNCRARTEFKLPAFALFVYCKGPLTAVMLRGTIMRPLCSWCLRWRSGAEMVRNGVSCDKPQEMKVQSWVLLQQKKNIYIHW
jgi:hypothetical protein